MGIVLHFLFFGYFLNNGTRINFWCFEKTRALWFCALIMSWKGKFTYCTGIFATPTSVILAVYIPASIENNANFHVLCLSSTEHVSWYFSTVVYTLLSHNTLDAYFLQSFQQCFSMTHIHFALQIGWLSMKLQPHLTKILWFWNPSNQGGHGTKTGQSTTEEDNISKWPLFTHKTTSLIRSELQHKSRWMSHVQTQV